MSMEGLLCVKHYGRPVFIHFPILPASDSPSMSFHSSIAPPFQLSLPSWLEVESQAWGLPKALLAGSQLSTLNLSSSMMTSYFLLCSFRVLQPQPEYLPPSALLPCPSDFSLAVTHWCLPCLRCVHHGLFKDQDKCPLRILMNLHCNGPVTFGCLLPNYMLCKRRTQV